MVHPLRKYMIAHDLSSSELLFEVPYNLVSSQAFSRPNLINHQNRDLLAYSVRGSNSKYRIEICEISTNNIFNQKYTFECFGKGWESEMVEYPYLVDVNGKLKMFYNGNGFGRSGIGFVGLEIG